MDKRVANAEAVIGRVKDGVTLAQAAQDVERQVVRL